MITKEQFEAHVRAEALKEYPEAWRKLAGGYEIDDGICERMAYIKTRMQHEWPLMDVVQKFVAWMYMQRQEAPLTEAEQALAPYTTKPTEQP